MVNVLVNDGKTLIHNLLNKIPGEQYVKRTGNNLSTTRMESYTCVINLLQKGFQRGSGRHVIESTKWKKERTEQRVQRQRSLQRSACTSPLEAKLSNFISTLMAMTPGAPASNSSAQIHHRVTSAHDTWKNSRICKVFRVCMKRLPYLVVRTALRHP